MDSRQQKPYQKYQNCAEQPIAHSPSSCQLDQPRLITFTVPPVPIIHLPDRHRKQKQGIIHDITALSRKRRLSTENALSLSKPPLSPQQPNGNAASLRQRPHLVLQIVPTPREQLQLMRSEMKSEHQQEDDYLKHNLGTVKQKIRNKLLKHRIDFALEPSKKKHQRQSEVQRGEEEGERTKQRIDRYNHQFEEYLIRRRISKKRNHTINHPESRASHHATREAASPIHLQTDEAHQSLSVDCSQSMCPNVMPLHCSSDNSEAARLIIVSPLNPTHQVARFRNVLRDTARHSCSNHPDSLLKRFLNHHVHHPPGRSLDKQEFEEVGENKRGGLKDGRPGANFIKSPLNYSLLKRQIHKVRKESIGLPYLLEAQQESANQSLLEEKIKAKKISSFMTISPTDHPPKKYVVYSKKNIFVEAAQPATSSQELASST